MKIGNIPLAPALDEQWFVRFNDLLRETGEIFAALELPQDELRRRRNAFETSQCIQNPDLLPRHINTAIVTSTNLKLEQLKSDIVAKEKNPYVKTAYQSRIEEAIHNNLLLIAAAEGDNTTYMSLNEILYGKPNTQLFAAVCDWIRTDAQFTTTDSPKLKKAINKVLAVVPNVSGTIGLIVPEESVFNSVRELHRAKDGYYEYLFGKSGLPTKPMINQLTGDDICRQVLQNIGYDAQLAYAENGIWAVLRSQGLLVRPPDYVMEREEFIGIITHEIGSHLLESHNGSRQRLRLLQEGLEKYEFGSEGRAFLREQICYKHEATFLGQASWEYIIAMYLLVGLAYGLYNHQYSFSELYEVAHTIHSFWRHRRHPNDPKNEASIDDEAWFITVRILKGSDGSGGAYLKDVVYLEGNVRCWQVAAHNPAAILYGDYGKFDISRPEHVELLQALEILPKNLLSF